MIPGAVGLLFTGLWLFAIFDCVINEPEKTAWIVILLFFSFPGSIIYLLIRWLPRRNSQIPNFFGRWTRKRELWSAEVDAKNIGKAYQYIKLGDIRYDIAMYEEAEEAYQMALEKESDNNQALWGLASAQIKNKKFVLAKENLEKLLEIDPEYKYGDASLAYGETLFNLQELDSAKEHLQRHLKSWTHPEAAITLAKILAEEGDRKSAHECLQNMISKLKGSSYFHYKRHRRAVSRAEKLLRKLS
ncbi:MAG: tetratricopeptide repeat protein [Cyanobacteria bacterium P01_A01_bin.84]